MIEYSLSAGSWAALTLAWVAAVASPGPDVFLLLRLAVRERRAAVYAALGIMTGNTLWITASILGLTAVLAVLPWLLPTFQIVGALVLVWIGIQSIRAGIMGLKKSAGVSASGTPRRPYWLGFVTNIANPKALIFFTALLTQFLPPETPTSDRIAVIAMMISTGLVWFVSVALACSIPKFRVWFQRAAPWLDIVAGIIFILVSTVVGAEAFISVLAG